jgi:hypothetical protein
MGGGPAGGGGGGAPGSQPQGNIHFIDFGGDRVIGTNFESALRSSIGSTRDASTTGTTFNLKDLNFGPAQQGNVLNNGTGFLGQVLDKIQQQAGVNPNGTISAAQIADYLIPGNAYLSGSQKWDFSNFVTGLIKNFTGINVNQLMMSAGKFLTDNPDKFKWLPEWMRNILTDHYNDNKQNYIDKMNGGPKPNVQDDAGVGGTLGARDFGTGWLDTNGVGWSAGSNTLAGSRFRLIDPQVTVGDPLHITKTGK